MYSNDYDKHNMTYERRDNKKKTSLGSKLNMNIQWDEIASIVDNIYEENVQLKKVTNEEVEKYRKMNTIDTKGVEMPKPIMSFDHVPFPDMIKKVLKKKYSSPTPIQAQVWPVALTGKDLVGSAETGSGKTIAFLLPTFEQISKVHSGRITSNDQARPLSLIVVPTRELVKQIYTEALEYSNLYGVDTHFLHGGQNNRFTQGRALLRNPKLIVGTPGRIIDFIEEGSMSLERVHTLILDEADRMFEMGFEEQLKMILSQISPKRHIMMFSATWPKKVASLAREYFKDFIHINVGPEDISANKKVSQKFEFIPPFKKTQAILDIVEKNPNKKILVFANTKMACTEINQVLRSHGIKSGEIHGDKQQSHRENTLSDLKEGLIQVLVATDVAARGLDIKNIAIVVNFDYPRAIEQYVHRIGRTGRAGQTGESITFFTPLDGTYASDLINILKLSNQPVPEQLSVLAGNWRSNNNAPNGNNNKIGLRKYDSRNNFSNGNRRNNNYNNGNRRFSGRDRNNNNNRTSRNRDDFDNIFKD